MDVGEVTARHAAVLAGLDPLLAAPGALVADDDVRTLTVRVGGSVGVGQARFSEAAPDAEAALWGPLRSHRLMAHLAGPDRGAALAALLDEWEPVLGELAEPGDLDCGASMTVPSRDTDTALPLLRKGFAPLTVIAARLRPTVPGTMVPGQTGPGPTTPDPTSPGPTEPDSTGLDPDGSLGRVRVATAEDLDVMVELAVELQHVDAAFGMVTERPASPSILRAGIDAQLRRAPDLTWVGLDDDGRVAGFAQVQPPAENGWLAAAVAGPPPAYFGYLYVRPDRRGAGLGAALVDAAHRAIDADPTAAVTVLHHALPSPYSTPFWARHGYRPLWTAYQRRPAVR